MGSSGGGSGNPMFLSQGGTPIPGLPIAGQGAPNDNPRNFGSFQNFLPDLPAAGGGPAPSATGLTSGMLQYKSPQGVPVPAAAAAAAPAATAAAGGADGQRQQLAALQAQFGAAREGGGFGGGFGGGPFAAGLAPPPGARQLARPAGGWVDPARYGFARTGGEGYTGPGEPGFAMNWRELGI